ncbi:F-box protein CPR1-like [Papaver somniferum]|uniref:F-box protein CPR1-like n=1 Tax=Papaver somniferum TaxID=3469 RepID=UPI000E6FA092|nr:F-box protein CPR1-like [Papaver somniferum]
MANNGGNYSEIAVYSLKLNLWKTYRYTAFLYLEERLVFFQGIFHWMQFLEDDDHPRMIGSFDIDSKAFKLMPLPQHISNKDDSGIYIRLLGGCLYLIESMGMSCCEVWMMSDHGIPESWTKMFSIDEILGGGYLLPQQSFKNDVIFIQAKNKSYLYDLRYKKIRKSQISFIPQHTFTWPILGTLVSPNLCTSLRDAVSHKKLNKKAKHKDVKERYVEENGEAFTFDESYHFMVYQILEYSLVFMVGELDSNSFDED